MEKNEEETTFLSYSQEDSENFTFEIAEKAALWSRRDEVFLLFRRLFHGKQALFGLQTCPLLSEKWLSFVVKPAFCRQKTDILSTGSGRFVAGKPAFSHIHCPFLSFSLPVGTCRENGCVSEMVDLLSFCYSGPADSGQGEFLTGKPTGDLSESFVDSRQAVGGCRLSQLLSIGSCRLEKIVKGTLSTSVSWLERRHPIGFIFHF